MLPRNVDACRRVLLGSLCSHEIESGTAMHPSHSTGDFLNSSGPTTIDVGRQPASRAPVKLILMSWSPGNATGATGCSNLRSVRFLPWPHSGNDLRQACSLGALTIHCTARMSTSVSSPLLTASMRSSNIPPMARSAKLSAEKTECLLLLGDSVLYHSSQE